MRLTNQTFSWANDHSKHTLSKELLVTDRFPDLNSLDNL
jgi:hypothetical protein